MSVHQLSYIDNFNTHGIIEKLARSYQEGASDSPADSDTSTSQEISSRPIVSLLLRSGGHLRGHLIAMSGEHENRTAVVQLENGQQSASADIAYVQVSDVTCCVVHDAERHIDLISDGVISRPLQSVPTLEEILNHLRSMMQDLAQGLTLDMEKIPTPASPELRYALFLSGRDLWHALHPIAVSELGRQALQEKPFHFVLRVNNEAQVQVHPQQNQFIINLGMRDAKNIERVSRESIRLNLEEFL